MSKKGKNIMSSNKYYFNKVFGEGFNIKYILNNVM